MKGFAVMRGSAIAASLALSIMALSAAPVFAQTAPPAQTPPKPAQPAPTQPAAPAPQVPAQPPAPFPQGAKVAYINPQLIFQQSVEGKAAIARVQALVQTTHTPYTTHLPRRTKNYL